MEAADNGKARRSHIKQTTAYKITTFFYQQIFANDMVLKGCNAFFLLSRPFTARIHYNWNGTWRMNQLSFAKAKDRLTTQLVCRVFVSRLSLFLRVLVNHPDFKDEEIYNTITKA